MRLHLVRHARPIVPANVCYGRSDLEFDPDHQRFVLSQLVSLLPLRLPVMSSPLHRCRMLATELAGALHSDDPVIDARLAEMDFGTWEMQSWDAIPRQEIDAWSNNLLDHRPGGGESLLDVAMRVQSFVRELRERRLDEAIVVAHAGTIRMMLAARECEEPREMVALAAGAPSSIRYGELATIDC